MVQIGSAGGLSCKFSTAKVLSRPLSRLTSYQFLDYLRSYRLHPGIPRFVFSWIVGIVISMVGGVKENLGVVYAGRLIAGFGVGMAPIVK